MITAKKVLSKQGVVRSPVSGLETYLESNAENAMIEFAKTHVHAALVAAHKQSQLPMDDLMFTLNVYPLENIK